MPWAQCSCLLLLPTPGIWSVVRSLRVMSDSLPSHGLLHFRVPCPSLPPTVCSNSRPLSQWCYLTSHPLLLLPSIFPNIGVSPVSQLFASGGPSFGASASVHISPNKPTFTLLWLTLEFFPAQSQGPSHSGPSQELTRDLGHDHPLVQKRSWWKLWMWQPSECKR